MRSRSLLASIAVGVSLSLVGTPALASAATTNVTATSEYLAANYSLVRTARSYLRRAEAAPLTVLAQVTRDCPRAAAGSPQDPQSTEMSYEVIGAMVISAYHLDVPGLRSFIARVRRLHWSDPRAGGAVKAYAGKLEVLATLAPPNLCSDIRAWAASGFKTLAPSTVRFDAQFTPAWVALGELPGALRPYERTQENSVLARCNGLEVELTDGEARAVEKYSKIMNELEVEP